MKWSKSVERVLLGKFRMADNGCWLWTAAKDTKGYGVVRRHYKMVRAHRLAYEFLMGPIPEGLVLDHLCRTPACIRPDHLEPVTQKENIRRGTPNPLTLRREWTHCIHGHPFEGDNLMIRPEGGRRCRTCYNAIQRRRSQRLKAERAARRVA